MTTVTVATFRKAQCVEPHSNCHTVLSGVPLGVLVCGMFIRGNFGCGSGITADCSRLGSYALSTGVTDITDVSSAILFKVQR